MRRCVLDRLSGRFAWCCRQASTSTKALEASATLQWTQLTNRALIRLSGVDVSPFLQGLITNDMKHFEQFGESSAYAMLLNNRGRVLNDLILYPFEDPNGAENFLLECDRTQFKTLTDVLLRYRMRKKVDMVSCTDSLSVFSLFPKLSNSVLDTVKDPVGGTALPTLAVMRKGRQPIFWGRDPRVPAFGGRVVLPNDQDEIDAYFKGLQQPILSKHEHAFQEQLIHFLRT